MFPNRERICIIIETAIAGCRGGGGGLALCTPRVSFAYSRPGLAIVVILAAADFDSEQKSVKKRKISVLKNVSTSLILLELNPSASGRVHPHRLHARHGARCTPLSRHQKLWSALSKTFGGGGSPFRMMKFSATFFAGGGGRFLSRSRIGSWRLWARSPGQIENPMRTCTYVLSCTIGVFLCREALRYPLRSVIGEEGADRAKNKA